MPSIKVTGFMPKELINIDAVRLQLLNALRAEGREIRRDFWKTTRTWKHKPKFEMKVSLKRVAAEGSIEVFTTDEIYGYVSGGTRRHIIKPKVRRRGPRGRFAKAAKTLAFPSSSTPKTRPGVVGSGRGGSSGPTVFRRQVMHPGIKARKFDEAIKAKIEKTRRFQKRIDAAIAKGLAKVSGEVIVK